ncbi:DUF3592 domain-containing protein [Hymenobacter psoromatis]|uniref:DUF3592 domain-containing protein n=1 Tax=Hymenobacter psoromatis TaxID=1484116 RepID=UPI001CBFD65F|nr:DUF3592 domain-containing protein [Hymenobacter psoromatis]
MQLVAHLVYWYSTHALYCMPVAAVLIPAVLLGTRSLPAGVQQALTGMVIGLAVLTFFTIFAGSWLAGWLVYRVGETGQGEVVSTYATSVQYNNHDVRGHHVLLRTQTGQTVATSFEDDNFNVYPPANSVNYPDVGEKFTARYLPAYPQDFVIITNDNSPYAHGKQCAALLDSLQEARRTHEFDLTIAASKQAYRALIHRVIARGCYTDSTDLREYDGDLAKVQLEPCQALLDSLDIVRTRYNADVADETNKRVYLALIRRVVARPPCYTDSADLRKYYSDMKRVQASYQQLR